MTTPRKKNRPAAPIQDYLEFQRMIRERISTECGGDFGEIVRRAVKAAPRRAKRKTTQGAAGEPT